MKNDRKTTAHMSPLITQCTKRFSVYGAWYAMLLSASYMHKHTHTHTHYGVENEVAQ